MLNTNHADKIVGGIQTVERLHISLLIDLGHDVTFIASSDTAEFEWSPRLSYSLTTLPSEEGTGGVLTKAQKGQLSREKTKEIREMLLGLKPDLIICHSYSSSHVKLMADWSETVPVMVFVHQTPAVAMDISMIAKVEAYLRLTNNGGKLMMTSPYQRNMWRDVLTKRVNSGSPHFSFLTVPDIHRIYDWIVASAYMSPTALVRGAENHFVVVSRPDPAKNVGTLLELLCHTTKPIHLKFFVAWPGDLKDNPYYVKRLEPKIVELNDHGFKIEVFQNATRVDVLAEIASARAMFLPGPNESSPMTLMEATQYGLRPITFAKRRDNGWLENAASTMMAPEDLDVIDAFGDKTAAAAQLDAAIAKIYTFNHHDRMVYRDKIYQVHSYDQRRRDLEAAIDLLLEEFKPQRKPLMDF